MIGHEARLFYVDMVNKESREREGILFKRVRINGQKFNHQPPKTQYPYRPPSNEQVNLSRQMSQISLFKIQTIGGAGDEYVQW